MTIISINSHPTTTAIKGAFDKAWDATTTLLTLIAEYCETRKTNKPRPFYHNDKEQRLERAHRDVNRLRQHHF